MKKFDTTLAVKYTYSENGEFVTEYNANGDVLKIDNLHFLFTK